MREEFLPFSVTTVTPQEMQSVMEVLDSGWLTTGPIARKFEDAVCAYIGASAAVALNSCTAGMHIALRVKGIGEGAKVITSPLTFCSTVNVIEHVGATPVLVDVELESGNISPEMVEQKIDGDVKALMPVHYGGFPCGMNDLRKIAEKYSLFLLEDGAHAIGAEWGGSKLGADSAAIAFSFYATKNMTTAEGGMLVSSDKDFIEECRALSLHGMSRDAWKRYDQKGSWYYEVEAPGFKYNMPDVLAALGLEQLARLDEMNAIRAQIVRRYNKQFDTFSFLEPFQRKLLPGSKHAHHLYPIVLKLEALSIDRARFIEELKVRNIGTSVHFIPIHFHPFYKNKYGWRKGDFPNAEYLYERFISLPLYPSMTDGDVDDVIAAVYDVSEKFKS